MTFEPTQDEMMEGAQEAAQFLKALSNDSRMLILCRLAAAGEMSVSQLEADLQFRQSKLSQHLTLLRAERLVATRREGKSIYYRLVSSEVERTLELMHQMFCSEDAVARRREDRSRYRGAA
ncbi:MAG: metalloregulator ArsR/SmtB family transcription factor [Pseudomonadota bacterium]